MNYLAHAILAQPNLYSLTGNLLGDFCKGVALDSLPPQILAGLLNHRAVDRFTDQHPLVREAKQMFAVQRRRFAGVALDVLFDHFLIKHWQAYYPQPFADYKIQLYQQLALAEPLMPAAMAHTMRSVRQHDWLHSYQHLASVGQALDQIAARIRFTNQFGGAIDDIAAHYPALEQLFLQFYPRLCQHITALALES